MKLRVAAILFLCLTAIFVAPCLRAQEGSIKQAMSSEEFHRAGLDKLSDDELKNLDRWLQGDREKTAKKASSRASRTKMDLIVSRVNGSFGGLGRSFPGNIDRPPWRSRSSRSLRVQNADRRRAGILRGSSAQIEALN